MDIELITKKNLKMNDQDVCRFCLYQNNNFYHLFSEDLKNSDLHGKIINYLKIEIYENDDLPKLICENCLDQIQNFHRFHEAVTHNQNLLICAKENFNKPLKDDSIVNAEECIIDEYLKSTEETDISKHHEEQLNNIVEIIPTTNETEIADSTVQTEYFKIEILDLASLNANTTISAPRVLRSRKVIPHATVSHSEESESDESSVGYNDDIDEIDDENDNEDNDTEDGENDKYVSDERFKGFPKKIIENNKLLIRGKSLKKLMSKFYRLECDICIENNVKAKPFKKLSTLSAHFNDAHLMKGYVICCGSKFIKHRSMAMHMARHLQPKAFRCDKCGKMMTCPKILQYHIQNHLPENERPLSCTHCPKRFSYGSALVAHSISHQPEHERTVHVCDECGKTFSTYGRLSTHINAAHTMNEPFICHICAKPFTSKGNLSYHLTTHQPNAHQVQCEHCQKWLKNKLCLRKHMVQHSDIRHTCSLCEYSTLNRQCLRNHIRVQHSDLKPFVCDLCSKSFKLKNTLINHMVQHTGIKKYSCPFCTRTFASSGNYYSHRKRMHADKLNELKQKKLEEDSMRRSDLQNQKHY